MPKCTKVCSTCGWVGEVYTNSMFCKECHQRTLEIIPGAVTPENAIEKICPKCRWRGEVDRMAIKCPICRGPHLEEHKTTEICSAESPGCFKFKIEGKHTCKLESNHKDKHECACGHCWQ